MTVKEAVDRHVRDEDKDEFLVYWHDGLDSRVRHAYLTWKYNRRRSERNKGGK